MSGVGGVSAPPKMSPTHWVVPLGCGHHATQPGKRSAEPQPASSLQTPLPVPQCEERSHCLLCTTPHWFLPCWEGDTCDYVTGGWAETLTAAKQHRIWAPVMVVVWCGVVKGQLVMSCLLGSGGGWCLLRDGLGFSGYSLLPSLLG